MRPTQNCHSRRVITSIIPFSAIVDIIGITIEQKEYPLDLIPMKRFSTISILPAVTIIKVERTEEGALVTDAMLFANGIQSIE